MDVPVDGSPRSARVADRTLATTGMHSALAWGCAITAAVFAGNLFEDRYLFWDSYLDLGAGRLIVRHGIPHHEVFTVAARGTEWIDQQWLAHVLTYASWAAGGYAGVALLSSLAVASAFGLLCAMMITHGVHPQRAVMWTGAAIVVCIGNTVIRAEAFAFPLFVIVLWGVLSDASQARWRRRNYLAIPLLVLWANLHGSVLLGALIVAVSSGLRAVTMRGCRTEVAKYVFLAAAAPLTVFANPYGFSVVHYYGALIGNPAVSTYILEWAPPSFGNPFSIGFIVLLLVTCGVMGAALARGVRPSPSALAMLLVTGAAATQGVRYAPWFALVAAAVDGETLACLGRRPHQVGPAAVRFAAAVVLAFLAVSLTVLLQTPDSTFERLQPRAAMAAAAAYAHRHPGASILADDTSSSALLWKYPELQGRVAFDARLEQFSAAQLERWFRWMTVSGAAWQSATRSYDVVVITRKDHPDLVRAMIGSGIWRPIETSDDGVALARTSQG